MLIFFFNSSHPPNPESLNLAVKPNSLYSLNLTTFENKKTYLKIQTVEFEYNKIIKVEGVKKVF